MIKEYIETLDAAIVDLDLIERWGGHCQNETKDGKEFGMKTYGTIDCHGNMYTPDDRFKSVGYVYVKEYTTEPFDRKSNILRLTTVIKLFGTPAKMGETIQWHNVALHFLTQLNQVKYLGKRYSFQISGNDIHGKFEEATLTEVRDLYLPCDFTYTPGESIAC